MAKDEARSGLRDGFRAFCTSWPRRSRAIGVGKWARNITLRPVTDTFLFLQVCAFAAAVPLLLRLRLSRLGSLLELGSHPSAADEDKVEKIAAYVETAIRRATPLVRRGCLTRSLTRYYFFRRAGMDVSLCFGMAQAGEDFVGHCWLERDGAPFLEVADPRTQFSEMYRICSSSRSAPLPQTRANL